MTNFAREAGVDEATVRPSNCPFCHGRAVDTLAKVITPDTSWRCRSCEKTWTIGRLTAPGPRASTRTGR